MINLKISLHSMFFVAIIKSEDAHNGESICFYNYFDKFMVKPVPKFLLSSASEEQKIGEM